MTARDLHVLRMIDLAGRAAERLVFGDISAGAGGPPASDLGKATRSALRQELSFGLGSQGALWVSADPDPDAIPQLPAATQRRLADHLARAEAEAGDILARNRTLLVDLATTLRRTNLLQGPELQGFLDRVVAAEEDRPDPTAPISARSRRTGGGR